MKILSTIFWIILFSLFLSSDTTISQPTIEVEKSPIINYSNSEIYLRELNSRIKLSRCELILLKNQRDLHIIESYNHQPSFLTTHNIIVRDDFK
jgi:hypothetical protein